MQLDEKPVNPNEPILGAEILYRRYPDGYFKNGQIDKGLRGINAIPLPDLSVDRKKYRPNVEDVRKSYPSFGVVKFKAESIPASKMVDGVRTFTFRAIYDPMTKEIVKGTGNPINLAHSEVRCFENEKHLQWSVKDEANDPALASMHVQWRIHMLKSLEIELQPRPELRLEG